MFSFLQTGWAKVKAVLHKTTETLASRLRALFSKPLDQQTKEELEKILYEADLGVSVTNSLIRTIDATYRTMKDPSVDTLLRSMEEGLLQEMGSFDCTLKENTDGPTVILVLGANGHGKTTSIAKLCHMLKANNKTVLVAACDTFRAAAQEQLDIWMQRVGCEMVRGKYQQDPASIAFDAIQSAKAKNIQYVILDTAGRLENRVHLMKELEKIAKTCAKACPGSPHESLLVLDATIGQNGIQQARVFHASLPLSGLILTKLDGSAKGGIVLSIQKELQIPVKCIGTGESMEDFSSFSPRVFVRALLGLQEEEKR